MDNNSSTLILSTSTRGPSVAPAMSAIVAGSPVERRHCPALSLLTAVDTCKASSWAGTRSCPTLSAASIMPIFPHPLSASRLADVSPMISQRQARGPRRNLPRGPGCDTLPYQLITPILHCVYLPKKKKKFFSKHRRLSTFSSSRLPFFRLSRAPLFF